jgi:SAM-dependent methyltransferase
VSPDDWDDIADWWIATVGNDPADSEETLAVMRALVEPGAGRTLDLGCGDGRILPLLGDGAIGVDSSHTLLVSARDVAPVVRSRLPDLSWVRPGTIDQAVAVGIVDLLADERQFFEMVAAAVRPAGVLVVVMNHPVVTAPESEPLVDDSGQMIWNWGRYLHRGSLIHPAGHRTVELHHRPLGDLLTTAATAGWRLERLVEAGATDSTIDTSGGTRGQEHLPVLLGARWRRS